MLRRYNKGKYINKALLKRNINWFVFRFALLCSLTFCASLRSCLCAEFSAAFAVRLIGFRVH